jgi:hypothetical protein
MSNEKLEMVHFSFLISHCSFLIQLISHFSPDSYRDLISHSNKKIRLSEEADAYFAKT